ncbi:ketopantoate reductase PanE/ApbA C terminal-domain-containing protein [Fomitopsis serialis]|uniref:ketopantoate reductase PanE/ApbA C terminal-domain-containing protein n=1 Tax=Fomitopsis serialis TaxID=139415 RepID=UPI002007EA1D|nr:ketopantoate reductase PanE/ApbA C terminal-domain-containing protein [Neoantrodia serialis]KAH9937276.1 ketopantoate reductase PanE/ApbA C terminal-domain-containing protein [Neoantrodia serialis]
MHVHVLGFGAVGSLVSHYLRGALDPKHAVSIIHKSSAAALRASSLPGVKLELGGVTRTQHGVIHESTDPPPTPTSGNKQLETSMRCRTCRTNHNHHLRRPSTGPRCSRRHTRSLPRLSAASTIVLLHNGMGVYEHLVENVFRNRQTRPHFVVSVNTHGAFVKSSGHVVHTGVGSIQLGIMHDTHGRDYEAGMDTSLPVDDQKLSLNDITSLQGDPDVERYLSLRNTISALTSTTALDISWRPLFDVQLAMHRKLAVNCVVNPLTALLGCRNGDLFKHQPGSRLAAAICREISNVFFAQWQQEVWKKLRPHAHADPDSQEEPAADDDEVRQNILENPFPPSLHQQQLLAECALVAELTRENTSSMLVDVRRSRFTEISYLNGYVLKLAKKYRVNVPVTAALIDLIHLREAIPSISQCPCSRCCSAP